jgi:uncharacterized membrane protein YhfC
MGWWNNAKNWLFSLGEQYGVDPLIFGLIYVGAIPFFFLSLGWLIRSIRRKKPIVLPVLCTGLFFISAYMYLIIAGRNIPVWVYIFIALLVVYGAYSTFQKLRHKSVKGS